jgi:hypothetical protein
MFLCSAAIMRMDEDLKNYLDQSRLDMMEMKKMVKGIKNHFIRAEIYQWLIIALVVVPCIIAVVMLWPTLSGLSGQYGNILSNGIGAITGSDLNLATSTDIK